MSDLSSPSSYSALIKEQEVDVRIKAFEAVVRLRRKRRRFEALEKGEDPDEPVTFEDDYSAFSKRSRSEVWNKLQLPVLKYKGLS
jgi:hypothetical protein